MNWHYIGAILVICIFLYELRRTIKNKNWGKFNRTSAMVWGGVIVLIGVSLLLLGRMGK